MKILAVRRVVRKSTLINEDVRCRILYWKHALDKQKLNGYIYQRFTLYWCKCVQTKELNENNNNNLVLIYYAVCGVWGVGGVVVAAGGWFAWGRGQMIARRV